MSLADSASSTNPISRAGGGVQQKGLGEPRSWFSAETFENLARSPSIALGMPAGKRIVIHTDRVRAAPALTPTLSGTLGNNAIGLGVWGTFFPKSVGRFLGLDASPQLIQLTFGLRELATGIRLASDPTCHRTLWARVAGDAFDIAALSRLNRPENPKRGNVRLALGVVLAVTALDVLAAVRMTNVQRNCL